MSAHQAVASQGRATASAPDCARRWASPKVNESRIRSTNP